MALNDYADRELDATERPERPIPSGRVSAGLALGVASGLTVAGLAVAGLAGGRRALAVAAPLAATVWAYDLVLKATPVGPAAMAATRGLDVLLGAGAGHLRAAGPTALVVSAHTYLVTTLSRYEVSAPTGPPPSSSAPHERANPRAQPRPPLAAVLVGTAGVAAGAAGLVWRGLGVTATPGRGPLRRIVGGALLATYLGGFGAAQLAALRTPGPLPVRRAVGAGIHSLLPLQAALATGAGALPAALPVAAALPLASWLARRVSPT
jgi:4-hydroxybenzoate polyprenyltransferase